MYAIVKIQATMRGRLVRLRLEKIRNILKQRDDQTGEFDARIDESAFFFNKRVKEVYDREGPFQIPDMGRGLGMDQLVEKGPFRMKNQVLYHGQWTKDLKNKTGKGR